MAPLKPQENARGLAPRPRYIARLRLEELRGLRNRVRCTWLRHGSLRIVTSINRALLREARVTREWRQTACGGGIASLAAVRAASFSVRCCNKNFFCFLLGGDEGFFGAAEVLGVHLFQRVCDRVEK